MHNLNHFIDAASALGGCRQSLPSLPGLQRSGPDLSPLTWGRRVKERGLHGRAVRRFVHLLQSSLWPAAPSLELEADAD